MGSLDAYADHVIRLGVYKCFVIVGVRMATLMAKKDLTIALDDLEPIALLPMEIGVCACRAPLCVELNYCAKRRGLLQSDKGGA